MSQIVSNEYPRETESIGDYGKVQLLSELELAEWTWRVRQWQIDINLDVAGSGPYNGTYVFDAGGQNIDGVQSAGPATEREITTETGSGALGGDFFLSGSFDLVHLAKLEVVTIADVQVEWYVFTTLNASAGIGPSTLSTTGTSLVPSAATCTIYDRSLQLYDNSDIADPWTGTVVITPYKWWPYAPSSGGDPVFDEDTGDQINPNVVID